MEPGSVANNMTQALMSSVKDLRLKLAADVDKLKKIEEELEKTAEEELNEQIEAHFKEEMEHYMEEAKFRLKSMLVGEKMEIKATLQLMEIQQERLNEYRRSLNNKNRYSLNTILSRSKFVKRLEDEVSSISPYTKMTPKAIFTNHSEDRCRSSLDLHFESVEHGEPETEPLRVHFRLNDFPWKDRPNYASVPVTYRSPRVNKKKPAYGRDLMKRIYDPVG